MIYAVITALLLSFVVVGICIYKNLEGNIKAEDETKTENRIIYDQRGKGISLYRVGLYPASYNGCEVIAMHNALVMLGKKSSLESEIRMFQRCGAVILSGVFGSNPYLLGRVMRKHGIGYEKVRLKDINDGIYIISYWNKKAPLNGLHTVAAKAENGKVKIFNGGSFCAITDRAFIIAYKVNT